MLATIIDGDALWQTIWSGALGGIGVCVIFALTILGAARSADMRRVDRDAAAGAYAVLALAGFAGCIGVVVYAVVLITTK